MVAFLCVNLTPAGRSKAASPFFLFSGFVLSRGEQRLLLINSYGRFEIDASQQSRLRRSRIDIKQSTAAQYRKILYRFLSIIRDRTKY
jgi:hypothetical protein